MKHTLLADGKTTRILWDDSIGVFVCENCGKLIHYNLNFSKCPYCKAYVVHSDERGMCGK